MTTAISNDANAAMPVPGDAELSIQTEHLSLWYGKFQAL